MILAPLESLINILSNRFFLHVTYFARTNTKYFWYSQPLAVPNVVSGTGMFSYLASRLVVLCFETLVKTSLKIIILTIYFNKLDEICILKHE